jgi:hypothetical protein
VTFKKVLNPTMRLRRKRVKMVLIYQEMRSMQNFQPFTGTLGGRRRSNKIRSGKAFAVKSYYVGKHDRAPDEIKDLDDAWLVQKFGLHHIIAPTSFPGISVTTKGAPTSGCNVLRHFFTRFHFRRTKIERKGAEACSGPSWQNHPS